SRSHETRKAVDKHTPRRCQQSAIGLPRIHPCGLRLGLGLAFGHIEKLSQSTENGVVRTDFYRVSLIERFGYLIWLDFRHVRVDQLLQLPRMIGLGDDPVRLYGIRRPNNYSRHAGVALIVKLVAIIF